MSAALNHEPYCLPRPGETEPRIDTFRSERTNDTGHVIARPHVQRCLECAAQTVDGQPVQG